MSKSVIVIPVKLRFKFKEQCCAEDLLMTLRKYYMSFTKLVCHLTAINLIKQYFAEDDSKMQQAVQDE